jgi:hypothetical protein
LQPRRLSNARWQHGRAGCGRQGLDDGSGSRQIREAFNVANGDAQASTHGLHGAAGKIVFQSFLMLMTVQPFFFASSASARENVPTLVSGKPLAGP